MAALLAQFQVPARPNGLMSSILTALSVLAAIVFTAMLVVLAAEALDAHGRRR
jgi:hypothetical protein